MTSPLQTVEWESCPLPAQRDRELERFARRRVGVVPPSLRYVAACPWLARAQVLLGYEQGLLTALDFKLADVVSLAVSQQNSCRYCYGIVRSLLRIQGMSEAQLREVEKQLSQSAGDPRLAAAVAFARRMTRSDPLPGEEDRRALLAAGFSEIELKELAYVVAYNGVGNRIATLLALPPENVETMADQWHIRLLRPLLARLLSRHTTRGVAAPGPRDMAGLPYAEVVLGYGDSPIAAMLATVIREAWESPLLPRRAKALLVAIVARGLGCEQTAREQGVLLAAEDLPEAALREVLEHLHSPLLDEHERVLVPFARQTIHYRPAQVQRAARAVLAQLGPARFIEAVGILSLANAMCRLRGLVAARP